MRPRAPAALLLLAAFLLAPAVRAGDGAPSAAPPAASKSGATGLPWKAASAGKGRLEVLASGLAVLRIEGTPEEMGTQHGTLLRDAVRTLVRDYLPRVLHGTREQALARARAMEPQIPERHRREMKALAEAAGVGYDDVLLGSVVVELFGLNMCSGAVAFGPATADGHAVVGRNLEWPDNGILGKYGLVIAARPAGQRPFLSVGFPAFTGVVTGINGDGVFTAELVAMDAPAGSAEGALKGVPYPALQRRLLEECGTLAEAVDLLRKAPRTVPQNLLLADPEGGTVFECAASRCVERPAVEGLDVVTNYWGERDSPPQGDPRYGGLCEAFKALGETKVDAGLMEKAMRDVTMGSFASMMNLQCLVFEPARLRARIAVGAPPAARKAMTDLDIAALLGVKAPADRKTASPGTGK